MKKENKITIEDKEIIGEAITQRVEGYINKKHFIIVRSKGFQQDIGETDNEFIFEEDNELTDKEKDLIEEYINNEVKF